MKIGETGKFNNIRIGEYFICDDTNYDHLTELGINTFIKVGENLAITINKTDRDDWWNQYEFFMITNWNYKRIRKPNIITNLFVHKFINT